MALFNKFFQSTKWKNTSHADSEKRQHISQAQKSAADDSFQEEHTGNIMSDLLDRANGQSTARSNRVSGVVKFYSVQKCYGFIKRDDTKEYVFVHSKSVTGKNERRVTRSLAKGERVEFDVLMSDRSPEAINVTGPNNGPVLGSEYALICMQWHHYDALKQYLLQSDGIPPRDKSPRARRFFHRRPMAHSDRNGGYRNDFHRRRRPVDHRPKQSQADPNVDKSKPKQGRRPARPARTKKPLPDQERNEAKAESLLTESNLTTLLSGLNMGNKSLITANSTSSESLDFEKINTEDTNPCNASLLAATSRIAATFSKGN